MPIWQIIDSCRNPAVTDPPEFRVRVRDIEQDEHVLPTNHIGPQANLRVILTNLGIPIAAINAAFNNPPNCTG